MKKLIAIVALGASVIAAPAFAASTVQRVHSTNPQYDVYVDGHYVGSDPDPSIRAMLRISSPRFW
jgi:hypothetical protein